MMVFTNYGARTVRRKLWCVVGVLTMTVFTGADALDGPNVCLVKQKYNITKLVKYRAPMSVRTYEWCFSMPPRCSRWNTEMRDLTRHETEERTAEVAVCCPGYKLKEVSCVPICPDGRTGPRCSEDCPANKWGPNCIHECKKCKNGFCSPLTGECECLEGWQGESCDKSMPVTTSTTTLEGLLTTITNKPTSPNTTPRSSFTTTTTSKATEPITEMISSKPTTELITSPLILSTAMTVLRNTNSQTSTTARVFTIDETTFQTPETEFTKLVNTTEVYTTEHPMIFDNNITSATIGTKTTLQPVEEIIQRTVIQTIYNRTERPLETIKKMNIKPTQAIEEKLSPVNSINEINETTESTLKADTILKDATIKVHPTTIKFKPKEIWIRPAIKGESPIVETKIKSPHDLTRYKSTNNKDFTQITTPKTIIVSIIPTSVSYSTFKKISVTTASFLSQRNITIKSSNKAEYDLTKSMHLTTISPPTISMLPKTYTNVSTTPSIKKFTTLVTKDHKLSTSITLRTLLMTKSLKDTKTDILINRTNSMSDMNATISTSIIINPRKQKSTKAFNVSSTTTESLRYITAASKNQTTVYKLKSTISSNDTISMKSRKTIPKKLKEKESLTIKHLTNGTNAATHNQKSATEVTLKGTYSVTSTEHGQITEKDFRETNVTKPLTSTDGPIDDEEFHILTEPEHITAVMGDKGTDRASVDLVSVISIAGGVMMAVITVAVIIVMIERCKRPRYEAVTKVNDIRMQVMIDNKDDPPPYVRSIFHTPLPDPPISEKCHYQPISTLDRNLKQFMRPVIVQTISPIMLENFRGILECHYDHLPRRSNDFGTMQTHRSVAPSMSNCSELQHLRASVTESAIEALKCEAKLDVLDNNSSSEPLYAEIPCWRPPSEHAIEIMNLNGEAVTEL